jgi:hypothetical protein
MAGHSGKDHGVSVANLILETPAIILFGNGNYGFRFELFIS